MSHTAKTIYFYGIYAFFAGTGFLFMPNTILNLMGFSPMVDYWILVIALLTLGLSYYYISSARADNFHFFEISWKGRVWFFIATGVLAIL